MELRLFFEANDFYSSTEEQKAIAIIFYRQKFIDQEDVDIGEILEAFYELGMTRPNSARLNKKLKNSKLVINGKRKNSHRFTMPKMEVYSSGLKLNVTVEPTVVYYKILPRDLLPPNRGYLIKISNQINASYECGIYDGCAVLMRRLLETMLIHTYEYLGIEDEIKDTDGNYQQLAVIVGNAKNNQTLSLSRSSKEHMDLFRDLGNWSAHRIYYNTRYDDLSSKIVFYRGLVEELINKSNIGGN